MATEAEATPATSGERPFALLGDPEPPPTLGDALDLIAGRLREAFAVDVAVVRATHGPDPTRVARGASAADRALGDRVARVLAGLRPETIDAGLDRLSGGSAVLWPDLAAEPAIQRRIAAAVGAGGTAGGTDLHGAAALAMPLRSPSNPRLGAIALVSLAGGRPLGETDRRTLEALAPQIALAVQNAILRDRDVRTGRTLQAVLESTPNGVVVVDLEGRIALANRAYQEFLGVDESMLVGKPIGEVVEEHLKSRFVDTGLIEAGALAFDDDPTARRWDTLETVDGRVLERFSAPIHDAKGTLAGRVGIITDVTRAHRALEEARALAHENALLLEREERRAEEELALARAGAILRGAMTRAEVHEQLVVQSDALVASDKTAVFVSRRRGDLVAAATRGFSRAVARRLRYRAGEAQIGRAVLTRRQIVCHDTEADPRGMGSFAEAEGIRSFVHVPIEVGEGVYGVLNVNSLRPDAFGPREQRVLAELARHASVALQNALLFERERENAEALQDALLAEEPPEVPGLELATLYRAAADAMVGGDLYNIWRLSDGRVAVLVGDVSGKGVAAAGATAMIRFLAEGLSAREDDPGRLLDDLGRLGGSRLSEGSFVTVFLAVLDPRTGLMQWANAGHPPPILLGTGGPPMLEGEPDPPLGSGLENGYRTRSGALPLGAVLILYTDGILEAPAMDGEQFGEERLLDAALALAGDRPDAIAQGMYAAASRWTGGSLADDVALAVVRRTEP